MHIHSYVNSLNNKKLPEVSVGDTVRVHQKIKEGNKTRTQVFEGLVIARRHGNQPGATIVVRKVSKGIGIERTFPLYLPTLEKIEVTKKSKVRRSKLYFLREKTARETRKKLKTKELVIPGQESLEEKESEPQTSIAEAGKKKEDKVKEENKPTEVEKKETKV